MRKLLFVTLILIVFVGSLYIDYLNKKSIEKDYTDLIVKNVELDSTNTALQTIIDIDTKNDSLLNNPSIDTINVKLLKDYNIRISVSDLTLLNDILNKQIKKDTLKLFVVNNKMSILK